MTTPKTLGEISGLLPERNKGIIAFLNKELQSHFSQKDLYKAGQNSIIDKISKLSCLEVVQKILDSGAIVIKKCEFCEFPYKGIACPACYGRGWRLEEG